VREYHTNTVHTSSGGGSGGIHPLVAGMAGYMVGGAMANHNQAPAASPQVVYVNGQPQQAQQQPQDLPAQSVQYAQQATPEEHNEHGLLFWFAFLAFATFCFATCVHFIKKNV